MVTVGYMAVGHRAHDRMAKPKVVAANRHDTSAWSGAGRMGRQVQRSTSWHMLSWLLKAHDEHHMVKPTLMRVMCQMFVTHHALEERGVLGPCSSIKAGQHVEATQRCRAGHRE